jgi:putative transposase
MVVTLNVFSYNVNMLIAYKYRLYPNATQVEKLAQHFGCARHVYNWALAEKKRHYEQTGKSLSRRQLQDQLVASKKLDRPWLSDVNSQSLLAALLNLDTAFRNFFHGRAKFPRFKKKLSGWQAFQCPQNVRVDFATNQIFLPKIPGIKAVLHRSFVGGVKTVTIKRAPSGKYYASVLVDDGLTAPTPAAVQEQTTVGLDVGISHFATSSEGAKLDNPKHLKQALEQLAVAQRQLSRKKKGSANRARQRHKVALIHEQISNRRSDFFHQQTAKLVHKNHVVSFAVETLNIKGMIRNRKLSRSIADCGWGYFIQALKYKCARIGKNVLCVGRFVPSSKRCSYCGYIKHNMHLNIRQWQCPDCNSEHDRDINAAINIKQYALADALGQSVCVKRSPAAKHVSACAAAKGAESFRHGSQEAPAIAASAV